MEEAVLSSPRARHLLEGSRQRLVRGVGASTLALGLSYGCNFLLVPFVIQAWGAPGYGLWVTLFSTVAYLSLFDLGAQVYVQGMLAANFARGNTADFRGVLCRATAFYLWLGALAALLWLGAIALGSRLPLPVLARTLTPAEAGALAALGVNQLFISIPFGVFVTCYRASGQFVRAAWLGNIAKVVLFGSAVGVLRLGGGPAAMGTVHLGVGLLSAALLLIDSRFTVPEAHPVDLGLRMAHGGAAYLRGSLFNWLISLSNLVVQQAPVLVVAKLGSAEGVALFATHRMLANIAAYIPSIVGGPILPELSYAWSLRGADGCRRLLSRTMVMVILGTAVAALVVSLCAPLIFTRWTVGRIAFDPLLMFLLAVQAVTASGNVAQGWALTATNRQRAYSLSTLASGVLYTVGPIVVLPLWGLHGLVAAMIAFDLAFLLVVLPWLVDRELGVSRWLIAGTAAGSVGAGVAAVILVAVARHLFPGPPGVVIGVAVALPAGAAAALQIRKLWLQRGEAGPGISTRPPRGGT